MQNTARTHTPEFEQARDAISVYQHEIARIRKESPPRAEMRIELHLARIERFLKSLEAVDPEGAHDLRVALYLSNQEKEKQND